MKTNKPSVPAAIPDDFDNHWRQVNHRLFNTFLVSFLLTFGAGLYLFGNVALSFVLAVLVGGVTGMLQENAGWRVRMLETAYGFQRVRKTYEGNS